MSKTVSHWVLKQLYFVEFSINRFYDAVYVGDTLSLLRMPTLSSSLFDGFVKNTFSHEKVWGTSPCVLRSALHGLLNR